MRTFRATLTLALICVATTALAAPPSPATTQRWMRAIDSRNVDQWLSVRKGRVFTVNDGHVVAIDLRSGKLLWTSRARVESRPAIGGQTIYAPTTSGIVALDPRTGRERGRIALPAPPTLLTAGATAFAVYATGRGSRLFGLSDSLALRWQRTLARSWDRPEDIDNGVVLLHAGDAVLALDARTGAALAATDGVDDYVGRDGSTVWFSVANGGLKSLDLSSNRSTAIHNRIVRGAVRVEGPTAIAVIDGRLKTVSLPDGRETALPIDGRWVGGPADRTVFISRGDGIYLLRFGQTWSTRIVTKTSENRFLTSNGTQAVFARNDGTIVAVELANLRKRAPLQTACRFVEGVRIISGTALVHCDDKDLVSHLYAFDFPAAAR